MKALKIIVVLIVSLLIAGGSAYAALSSNLLFSAEVVNGQVNPFVGATLRLGSPFGKIIEVSSKPELKVDISGKEALLNGLLPDTTYTLTVVYSPFPGVKRNKSFNFTTYRQTELMSITASNTLDTSITAIFSRPVRLDGAEFSLKSSTATVPLNARNEGTSTVILQAENLSQGTTYQVVFPNELVDENGIPVLINQEFSFVTPGPLTVKLTGSVVSSNQATLELSFSDDIDSNELLSSLKVSPDAKLSIKPNGERRFEIVLTGLKSSTEYRLRIAAGLKSSTGVFLDNEETFRFRTRAPVVSAPATSSSTALKIEGKTIVVDKAAQMVYLYEDKDRLVRKFACASGVLYPTPGEWKVFAKKKSSMSLYDNSVFYYFTIFQKSAKGNNIGFHSIPVYPDGTLAGGLGTPNSHGCVRLNYDDAKFLYEWAPIGTKVIVR